jgi:hypothetical protein
MRGFFPIRYVQGQNDNSFGATAISKTLKITLPEKHENDSFVTPGASGTAIQKAPESLFDL